MLSLGGYVRWLSRFRYLVLVGFGGLAVGLGLLSFGFLNGCTNSMNPPAGADSFVANRALIAQFPERNPNAASVLLSLEATDGASVLRDGVRAWTLELERAVADSGYAGLVQGLVGYYTELALVPAGADPAVLQMIEAGIRPQLVASDNRTTLVAITLRALLWEQSAVDFSTDWLQPFVDSHPVQGVRARVTGVPAWIPLITEAAESDMAKADGIGLPVALLVMAWLLRSWRVVMVPLLAMGVSMASTFGTMYFVVQGISVMQATASLMSSILIAMNVDYSLFLLSRYREEVLALSAGRLLADQPPEPQRLLAESLDSPAEPATEIVGRRWLPAAPAGVAEAEKLVECVLRSSGHTVLVSGSTLTFCFLGLLLFKVEMMRAWAVSCSVTMFWILVVNLVCVPTVLLIGHTWLSGGFYAVHSPGQQGFWYRLGSRLMHPGLACLALVIALGVAVPMGMHALDFDSSDSMNFDLPRGVEATATFYQIEDDFGQGSINPFLLMIHFKGGGNITTPASNYQAIQSVLGSLVANVKHTAVGDLMTPVVTGWHDGTPSLLPAEIVDACLYSESACRQQPVVGNYSEFIRSQLGGATNSANTAVLVTVSLHQINPLDPNGRQWVFDVRDELKRLEDVNPALELSLTGNACGIAEVIDSINSQFPLVAAATVTVILVSLGLAFRSILIPIRTVFSGTLTLCYVFAICTFVYQYGWLDGLGISALQKGAGSKDSGLMFLVPGLSFQIIVGLSVDYDVFLLSRVIEYRDQGASNTEAIAAGLGSSGNIITAAGIIMAIAFFGMLTSTQPVLNQLSLFLIVAVLLDTFVVRILVVPPIMRLLGEANYWPRYCVKTIGDAGSSKGKDSNPDPV